MGGRLTKRVGAQIFIATCHCSSLVSSQDPPHHAPSKNWRSLVPRPSTPRPFGKLEREISFSNFPKGRGAEGLGTRLALHPASYQQNNDLLCTREHWPSFFLSDNTVTYNLLGFTVYRENNTPTSVWQRVQKSSGNYFYKVQFLRALHNGKEK